VRRQCQLLSIHRSGVYCKPRENPEREAGDSELRDRIFEVSRKHPVCGYRRICEALGREGIKAAPKRIRGLMRAMGLRAIYPKRRLSIGNAKHRKYPYLLTGVAIPRPDRVWGSDSDSSYNVLDVSSFRHYRINHKKYFAQGRNHINGIENFWSQAKRHMRKFNGIPKGPFSLYLKECEWRFNNPRFTDQFRLLRRYVKRYMG
jgi:transposase-like protein